MSFFNLYRLILFQFWNITFNVQHAHKEMLTLYQQLFFINIIYLPICKFNSIWLWELTWLIMGIINDYYYCRVDLYIRSLK